MRASLSQPRLSKYMKDANDDLTKALELYRWNALLSQSIYTYVQAWEICLRNKISDFLVWKYNKADWPYDPRLLRNLNANDGRRLTEAKDRQEHDRKIRPASTPSIVADLSAGFWVSQLNYNVSYSWRYNIGRVFPRDKQVTAKVAHSSCTEILTLRNRIAHHEPIYHLDLPARRNELSMITNGMCEATFAYAEATCTFAAIWKARP